MSKKFHLIATSLILLSAQAYSMPSFGMGGPMLLADTSYGEENENGKASCRCRCGKVDIEMFGGLGYRYDKQTTHIINENDTENFNSSLEFEGRHTAQAVFGVNFDLYNWLIGIQGDYGWMVDGEADVLFPSTGAEPLFFNDNELSSGYTADAQASLAYRWKVVKRDNITFSIVPGGGYKYWHMNNQIEGGKEFTLPTPPAVLPATFSGFSIIHFDEPNQQDWFGPYAQLGIELNFCKHWDLALFYQYHFLHVRSEFQHELDGFTFSPPTTLIAAVLASDSITIRSNDAHANLGGLDFSYTNAAWSWGIHFEGSKVFAHGAHAHIERERNQFIFPPTGEITTETGLKSKIEWTVYSSYFYAGYHF